MPGSKDGVRVLIAVGSNMGKSARTVHSAFEKLRTEVPGVEVVATSAMYRTDPLYNTFQVMARDDELLGLGLGFKFIRY